MLPPFCLAAVGVCPNQSQLFILTQLELLQPSSGVSLPHWQMDVDSRLGGQWQVYLQTLPQSLNKRLLAHLVQVSR